MKPTTPSMLVKYGGNAMESPELKRAFAKQVRLLQQGISPIIVHGGGPQISRALAQYNIESEFLDGLRITPKEAFEVVQMALCGQVNPEIVHLLQQQGCQAQGLSGIDQNCIQASKISPDLGHVGQVTHVDAEPIKALLLQHVVPVIAPIGIELSTGDCLNINADTVAQSVAEMLKVDYLVLLSNIPGVLDKQQKIISRLSISAIPELIEDGTISGGMIPKILAAKHAVENGVGSVFIADGRRPENFLLDSLSNGSFGTKIEA